MHTTKTNIASCAAKGEARIQLNGQPAVLTYDRHARFRYGRHGGNLNALLTVPGQDYHQTVLLIWSALDDATRARYPDPAMLVDHIAEQDDPTFEPALTAATAAGWFGLADK
ncbi:MAG: hypothetical protein CML13_15740 [Puniceicoccaceae bacterium]|nr:hypothetical protein [Puniceicoccaceae bacterium]|tara:strand:- start:8084 stop:8419 length:336 start_codon:yes stop_codon:yes gene_type:complete